ncbi:MAG: hypothetical protein WC753_04075 [Candidatus Gracilibacteria bacterium]
MPGEHPVDKVDTLIAHLREECPACQYNAALIAAVVVSTFRHLVGEAGLKGMSFDDMQSRIALALAGPEITEPDAPASTPGRTRRHDEPVDLDKDFH